MSADFDLCCHGTGLSLLPNTYSGSGTGLICYLLGSGFRRSFPGLKWPGRDVDRSPPSVPEIKSKVDPYACLPNVSSGRGQGQVCLFTFIVNRSVFCPTAENTVFSSIILRPKLDLVKTKNLQLQGL